MTSRAFDYTWGTYPDNFYYFTPLIKLKKIEKNGLIPTSPDNHIPSRIYLNDNLHVIENLVKECYKHTLIKNWVILKINTFKLRDTCSLHIDRNTECGYFIIENISPKYIKILKEIHF